MPLLERVSSNLANGLAFIMEKANHSVKSFLLLAIFCWQKTLSPFLGPRCRFYPSCSQYTKETLQLYPLHHAFIRSFKRILKCHPFHPGGIDLP